MQLAVDLVGLSQPFWLSVRFVGACIVLSLVGWSIVSFLVDTVLRAKKMHQIPCTKCRFFTGDYRLKCTVNPNLANTETAIDCPDYRKSS